MKALLLPLILLLATSCAAQTRQDTLRGSNGRGRDWWDVTDYDVRFALDTANQSISGHVYITFDVKGVARDSMQLDLQEPMMLDSVHFRDDKLPFNREGNAYWVSFAGHALNTNNIIRAYFHGKPRIAKNPPWNGGFVWSRDANGQPWVAVACQGLGASSWWPCKDYQSDEPRTATLAFKRIEGLKEISNGARNGPMHSDFWSTHFIAGTPLAKQQAALAYLESMKSFQGWRVHNPINLYNLTFYLGDYTTFTDTFHGEGGVLPLTFHPLRYNESKARTHFSVVKDMLRCFEWWMGPYPFYEDGYKLVEAPYLGMEHQSAIAYGNGYQMGYLGTDRSGTGVGLLFDYIIIHESGHEWFGNNITARDVADNWIHEGFTTYTETLYAEWIAGKEKAAAYNKGEWKGIENDRPIIGAYGVNDDGSGDKYDKGTAMLHMIRTVVGDDEKFRQLLRGLNRDFWHQTVTTKQVEEYISKKSGYDFSAFFNQYLRTTKIPRLEWYRKGKRIYYRFTNVVPGFSLPIRYAGSGKKVIVSEAWNSSDAKRGDEWEDNFLIEIEKVRKRSEL